MKKYGYASARTAERQRSRGFTLMEMMIVVAIIGIIASIIALNYAHGKSNAQVSASEADLKQIATALELYYSDNQKYPTGPGAVTPTLFGAASNQYMNVSPNSPGSTGGQYTYTLDTSGNDYTVTDPDSYDAASLGNLPQATIATGDVTPKGTKCGTSCTHLGYSNAAGLFGY